MSMFSFLHFFSECTHKVYMPLKKKKYDVLKIPTYEVTSVENVGKLFIYNFYSRSVVLTL